MSDDGAHQQTHHWQRIVRSLHYLIIELTAANYTQREHDQPELGYTAVVRPGTRAGPAAIATPEQKYGMVQRNPKYWQLLMLFFCLYQKCPESTCSNITLSVNSASEVEINV